MRHDLKKQRSLTDEGSADAWEKVSNLQTKTVQVWGTFDATWKLQGKIGDAADYDDLTSDKTAPEIVVIEAAVTDIKLVCTALASGEILAVLAGFHSRTE